MAGHHRSPVTSQSQAIRPPHNKIPIYKKVKANGARQVASGCQADRTREYHCRPSGDGLGAVFGFLEGLLSLMRRTPVDRDSCNYPCGTR